MGFIGSIAEFRDIEKLESMMGLSKRAGFRGASCIHPNQVKVANATFGPSPEEVEEAREVIDAYDKALAAGEGAITVRGKMVDVPVADRMARRCRIRRRHRRPPSPQEPSGGRE